MLRKLFELIAQAVLTRLIPHLRPPRIIYDREGGEPYLARYYLKGRPTMPDGSEPFDSVGNPKDGIIWKKGYGLYLHRFYKSDDDEALHNHPWKWAMSLILIGGYSEERRASYNLVSDDNDPLDTKYMVVRKDYLPGSFNYITKDDFHRVDLLVKDGWSLFLTGPKFSSWGFWDAEKDEFTPWREFIERRRNGKNSNSG